VGKVLWCEGDGGRVEGRIPGLTEFLVLGFTNTEAEFSERFFRAAYFYNK